MARLMPASAPLLVLRAVAIDKGLLARPVDRLGQWPAAREPRAACRALEGARLAALRGLYDERLADYRKSPPPADGDGLSFAKTK